MEEAVLNFLADGPKNSLQLKEEFIKDPTKDQVPLWKAISELVDKNKITTTHLSCNSTWSIK